jgi:outer membrane receptor protein involved in Fe transport
MQFYNDIEPRIAFKIQLEKSSSVKLSYNRNKQYVSLISNTAVPNPNDIWKLADKYVKPIDCSHYAIGLFKNFDQNKIETSVEIYYKSLKNLVEYKNGAHLVMNPIIETALINADGKNYGIEFFVKKNSGELDGWLSYTYSRSLKKTNSPFPEEIINNNQYYPSAFDKPHELTLMLTWHINRRVRLAGNFDYSTGRAITIPENRYYIDGIPVVQFSDRNIYRLPDYHRLDLSLSVDENLRLRKQWKGSWTFSIINVYGHKNIYSVYYVDEHPSAANNYRTASLYKLIIIGIPLVSLTYNFMF